MVNFKVNIPLFIPMTLKKCSDTILIAIFKDIFMKIEVSLG